MRDLIEEVTRLQPLHSPRNTPAMARRGEIIRREIPDWLRAHEDRLRGCLQPFKGRLAVRGSDGKGGTKAHTPWVRLHNPELSPSAQRGWYAVYLFRPDGEGAALCVSHGATRWDGIGFRPYPPAEIEQLMRWGRDLISREARTFGFAEGVELGSAQPLARAYQKAAAVSKTYARGSVPDEAGVLADAEAAMRMLGRLYRAVEDGA